MEYITTDISGWMSGRELKWIFERALEMESVVEVGVWMGRSTHALCSGCPGIVIAVDHFQGSPDELTAAHEPATRSDISQDFWKNVGHFKNISLLKMSSVKAASFFREKSIDMVFIDACHIYEAFKADLEAWLPICKRLICGHDIGYPSIMQGVVEIGREYKTEDGIWSVEL